MNKLILPLVGGLSRLGVLPNICHDNGAAYANVREWLRSENIPLDEAALGAVPKGQPYTAMNFKRGSTAPQPRYSLYVIETARDGTAKSEFQGKLDVLSEFAARTTDSQIISCFVSQRHSALLVMVPPDYAQASVSAVEREAPLERVVYFRNVARVLNVLQESGGTVSCIPAYSDFGWSADAPDQMFMMSLAHLHKVGTDVRVPAAACELREARGEPGGDVRVPALAEWTSLALVDLIVEVEKTAARQGTPAARRPLEEIPNYRKLLALGARLAAPGARVPSLSTLRSEIREVRLALERGLRPPSPKRASPVRVPVEEQEAPLAPATRPRTPSPAKRVSPRPPSPRERHRAERRGSRDPLALKGRIADLLLKHGALLQTIAKAEQKKQRYETEIQRLTRRLDSVERVDGARRSPMERSPRLQID